MGTPRHVLAVGVSLIVATTAVPACSPPQVAGAPLDAPGTGTAFGGVNCSSVRPQTEPDLMAWDPGSRLNLNRIRRQGVAVVHYEAKGCDVSLEVLSNCVWPASYDFSPYSATEQKVAHNANELFAELPVGAARLAGKLAGNHALRTDYMLVGAWTLPLGLSVRASDLRGTDCARATHVVSAVYVGGFAMVAGESRTIDATASLFGIGAGGRSQADVEVLDEEGSIEACRQSQSEAKENDRCAVPLRIALAPVVTDTPGNGCPPGSVSSNGACVPEQQAGPVRCPPEMKSDGKHCFQALAVFCPSGQTFVDGRGCVPSDSAPPETPSGDAGFWCKPSMCDRGPQGCDNLPFDGECKPVQQAWCFRQIRAAYSIQPDIWCFQTSEFCNKQRNMNNDGLPTGACVQYSSPPSAKKWPGDTRLRTPSPPSAPATPTAPVVPAPTVLPGLPPDAAFWCYDQATPGRRARGDHADACFPSAGQCNCDRSNSLGARAGEQVPPCRKVPRAYCYPTTYAGTDITCTTSMLKCRQWAAEDRSSKGGAPAPTCTEYTTPPSGQYLMDTTRSLCSGE